MRQSFPRPFVLASALAIVIALVLVSWVPASAQAAKPRAAAAGKAVPRSSDGHPDLSGNWSFATVTPLQRPKEFANRDKLTAEEAAKLEEQAVRDQFVDRPPPPGNPGAYNRFWIDSGTTVVSTHQTSLIVDPPDGRMPPLTSQGAAREKAREARQEVAAGPEDLTTWDRCLLGFNAGPPMIGGGYNAYARIFQTGNQVVLLNEMVHDVRIIPLDGRPRFPANIRQWKGESRGRWDGDTLVVETEKFRSEGTGTLSLRGLGYSPDENLRLTERFRRVDADTLLYEYTVDDPTVWTKPWTVSLTMRKTDEQMFEYACHEGNYGLSGILSAARALDKAPKDPAKKTGSR